MDISQPLSPAPVTQAARESIPPYLSNGVVGMRLGRRWFGQGVCIVSGLAGIVPGDRVEGLARAPFPLAGDLEVDGARYSEAPELARLLERRYDFSKGELTSTFEFGPGPRARVTVVALCPRTAPMLAMQQVEVTVDGPCALAVTAGIDPNDTGARLLERETRTPGSDKPVVDGWLEVEAPGGLTRCGAAYTTVFEGRSADRKVDDADEQGPLRTTYRLRALPGETYRLRQLSALVPSQMHAYPKRQATRLAAAATERGFDTLRSENQEAWRDIWRGRVVLVGADRRWQQLADAAFYYLQASAHRSSLFSTSMFGLAYWPNYHYYQGHVMWDIEAFAFPPLLLTQPDTARALLEYRFQRVAAAETNAAMHGYDGLMFPWASGPLRGDESIRTNAPLINFEQHVSCSVAQAFISMAEATADRVFRDERAWPVVEGVASWILSRIRHTERGYEVREAIGVAEQTQPQDNNVYMNLACAATLLAGANLARSIGRGQDAELWEKIAGLVHLPRRADGTLMHSDAFDPAQHDAAACTPEALAAIVLMGARLRGDDIGRSLRFDLDRVEPYLGHPMLSAPLGPAAAWLGERDTASELFEAGYADFVREPYLETDEFSRTRFPDRPEAGPFMANIGGFLSGLMLWLPRVRIGPGHPAGWAEAPVTMPSLWEGVEAQRVVLRGREGLIRASHGDRRARIEL